MSFVNHCSFCLLSVCLLYLVNGDEDCWWTGCQSNDWAVTGCGQYNRSERSKESCDGGNGRKYECCLQCKWTGCEHNDWAVKGCEHLGMTESRREGCDQGNRFLCCPRVGVTEADCWWTSCQQDDWAVTGCEQYNRVEAEKTKCDGPPAYKYNCCPKAAPTPGSDPEYPRCLWSPCQPFNQTDRGCPPEARQIGKAECPYGDQGEIFRCCFKVERNDEANNIEESSGETFVDFVKYLLFKGRNFTIEPDLLPCVMMDPNKLALLQIQDEGLRICDLCPNFPQKRLTNILLDTQPKHTEYNKLFGECFELCFSMDDCMAFSYDHGGSVCYTFDSTVATLRSEGGWTSVFMTQPSGILENWSYVRHTSLSGVATSRTTENDFLSCLERCGSSTSCSIVSYSLMTKTCDMFDSESSIKYLDLNYGYISAFNVRQFPLGGDPFWRFTEEGDIVEATKSINDKDECVKKHYNTSFSAYYSKPCLTNQIAGCDSQTGCKHCYYPEEVNQEVNLPICPDSESNRKQEIVTKLEREMTKCLENDKCRGVGFDRSKMAYDEITFQTLTKSYDASYLLTYPNLKTGLHQYLDKVELLPGVMIIQVKDSSSNYQKISNVASYEDCLKKLRENNSFSKASYSIVKKECLLGDTKIKFREEKDFVTIFEKPALTSNLKNFIRVPKANVDISKAMSKYDGCQSNCEEECAKRCVKNCAYVLIKFLFDKTECFFFEDKDDLNPSLADNTMALVKISTLDFTLESMNLLTPFQRHHIFDCFSENNEQSLSSLTTHQRNNKVSSSRRKRGIFDAIGKAFKKVGQFIGNAVKDTVKTVVNTAKGVVKSVGKVIKGDLKGAKKEFLDIPVVKDVKTVVDLGKAVVTGDWDKAKEKGIDLLQSSTLDLVTTVIPGGKIIGTAAKAAGKGLKAASAAGKKAGDKIKRTVDKKVDKVEHKNKKVKDDRKKEETDKIEERGNCKKRPKRATVVGSGSGSAGTKRKKPCDDDDDDEKYCLRPNFNKIIEESVEDCVKKEAGERCDYECDPGYKEEDPRITCKKVNNRHVWPTEGRCILETCPTGDYPLISFETPQLPIYYRPGFGKYITAYMLLFDKKRKLPAWSIAMQQADFDGKKFGIGKFKSKSYNTLKESDRNTGFLKYPCTALNGHQGGNPDYLDAGWDRGHLTPANVARWSAKAKKLINLFINIAPQDPKTNSGPWKNLERHVECNSENHPSLVATGISLDGVTQKSKVGGLLVPQYYWKMVCYKDEKGKEQVVGFKSENTHVTGAAFQTRKRQINTPVSQREIKRIMTSGPIPLMKNPWLMTATEIYKGREVAVAAVAGASQSVWFPVNAIKCAEADDLDDVEKQAWEEAFGRKKRKKSDIKKTPKPDPLAPTKVFRGCYDKDDPFFDDPEFEDTDGSDSDSDVDMADASQALAVDREKADGVSLVANIAKCNKRIVGYYTSWGKKSISAAHLKRLTHVIYAFIEMNADGSVTVGSADRATSTDPEKDKRITLQRLQGLMNLASKFPHLQVLFAVGGWANSQYFSGMAASPDKRIKFIASVIKLIEEFGFDGVDIDWEYPVTGGANEGIAADKQNYVTFMKELRTALDEFASKVQRSKKFLISFASAAGQWTLDPGYDLPGLLKYADFANVMTYDFFGAWESKWGAYTGPPAPLFFGMPPRFSGKTNVDWTMKYYACKSKTPHKINMGVPFYGRYWKNVGDPVDKSDNMWRMASAVNGKFEGGYVPWNEIESQYLKNGFEKHFHEKSKSPYAWSPGTKTFLGYENVQSLTHKKNYAAEKNVGGLMIWALELDDDNLSLLNTIASASLCDKTDPNLVNYKCSPIDEKRWWTSEDGDDKAGLCGRSAPLYKGYYPVCDPDDPGYSCCGAFGYCGTGDKYCKCPTCTDYQNNPEKITKAPIKPTVPVQWYFLNDPEGKRGRCGKTVPKLNGQYPTCNPDDDNGYCCSNGGYCGGTSQHCDCPDCVNFRKNPNYKFK